MLAYINSKSLSCAHSLVTFNEQRTIVRRILEQGIDYACKNYHSEFAFELVKTAMKNKVGDIPYKYAMAIEDDGNFKDSEDYCSRAKTLKEAVLMYVHNQDWDSAQILAEKPDSNSVHDVLVDQAKVAFEAKDLAKFESLLLRTQGPELALLAGPKLVQIGQYNSVAQPYLGGEMIKEAKGTIITGEE